MDTRTARLVIANVAIVAMILIVGVAYLLVSGDADDTQDAGPTTTVAPGDSTSSTSTVAPIDEWPLTVPVLHLVDGRLERIATDGTRTTVVTDLAGVSDVVPLLDGTVLTLEEGTLWHRRGADEVVRVLDDVRVVHEPGTVPVAIRGDGCEGEVRRWRLDSTTGAAEEIEALPQQCDGGVPILMELAGDVTATVGFDLGRLVAVRFDDAGGERLDLTSPTGGRLGPGYPQSAWWLCPGDDAWRSPVATASIQAAPGGDLLAWLHLEGDHLDGEWIDVATRAEIRFLDVTTGDVVSVPLASPERGFERFVHLGEAVVVVPRDGVPFVVDLVSGTTTDVPGLDGEVWLADPTAVSAELSGDPVRAVDCAAGEVSIYGVGELRVGEPTPASPACPSVSCWAGWNAFGDDAGATVAFSITSPAFTTPSGLRVGMAADTVVAALDDRLTVNGELDADADGPQAWRNVVSLDFRPRDPADADLALRFMLCEGIVREIRTGLVEVLFEGYPGAADPC